MLEFIHHAAVWQEDKAVLGVQQLVFIRILLKEEMMPRGGQELHAHGVDLGALHTGALDIFGDVLGAAGSQVAFQRMPCFMGQHIHIPRRAVPVGKDEGGLVIGQHFLITAAHFAGAAENVEHLVILHEVDELCRFGAELMVHLAGTGHQLVVAAVRHGVAVRKADGAVPEHGVLNAGALVAQSQSLLDHGHHLLHHFLAERGNLRRAVTDAVHADIAQLAVIVVAQDACLLVAILDHLIIDLVKLGAVGVKVNGFRLVSLTAHGGVSALLIQRQLRDGQLFAVQLRHCTAVQFLVSTGQGIFLFLQFDHPVVHAQHQVAQAGQNAGTERFFQRFGVRVGKNRLRNIACCIADRRAGCIKPFLFPAPIFIAGILGIMDGCQAGCRVVMGHHGVFFAVKLYQFFAALGSGHLFGILFALGQNLIQVRAFVLHF